MATHMPAPTAESGLVEVPPRGLRRIRNWGFVIALGGFLFGYDTGVIAGALLFIRTEFGLDTFQQGAVVSVLLLGAMVGALVSGRLSDRFGRRSTLGILGVVFAAGLGIAALSNGYPMLLLGRLVIGLGAGAVSALVPTYLAEVSPAEIRGRMLTLNQLLITVGLLAAYVVNLAFSGTGNWRAMFWVGVIPSVLLAFGSLVLPESPSWLVSNDRVDDARTVVASVANSRAVDGIIEQFRRREAASRRAERQEPEEHRAGLTALLAPRLRAPLAVGLTLAALQQFSGINTILYFAPTIIQATGLSASNAIFYSLFIGVINLLMTIVALRAIDRIGRRVLLLVSLGGMVVSLVLLGLSFVLHLDAVISLAFMLLYIVSFAVGMGPVFWVLVGEIFPPRRRAEGVAASSTTNWLSNFLVSLAFLPVVAAIGQGQTFWIFAVVCLLGVWFVGRYVPETRDRSFEEIDADLHARWAGEPEATEAGHS